MSLRWVWGLGGLLCPSHHFSVTWSRDFLSWATSDGGASQTLMCTQVTRLCVLVSQSCLTL